MIEAAGPLRVLHLLSNLGHGGIETWLMEMMRKNDRHKVQIDVCLTTTIIGSYETEFQQLGGTIHRCRLGHNPFAFTSKLKQILREGQYDIFHSHSYFATGYFLKAVHTIPGLRLVAHMHPTGDLESRLVSFPRPLFQWLMKRWIYRYAEAILGASLATLEILWGSNWRDDPRIHFQPNGIDLDDFEQEVDSGEMRKQLELPRDSRIVLTVGRYVPHKNQKIIPGIAAEICTEFPDVYFVLNGLGPLRADVENSVKILGLEDRFRFVSDFPSLIPLWKSSDVFLFPSLMEGFGIVVIEAAAAGLPVVACRVPGVIEAAAACHNATLLQANATPQEWAEAVRKALKAGKLSEKDYTSFKEGFEFTTQNSLVKLLEVYEQITERR